mgnify:CR=1 FL=1
MVGHLFDQEQNVKLGSRGFAALGYVVVPTEMHRESRVRKSLTDMVRRDPVFRIF